MKLCITGGAGFVGSSLAFFFKEKYPAASITVFDNLKRRGSELNLAAFKKLGIRFIHGDIRNPSDFEGVEKVDLLIECSAEPSALAGLNESPRYVLDTNLTGTIHCLEFARKNAGGICFLSTSRVYSISPLREIALTETEDRFEISGEQTLPGISARGISEDFPTHRARSIYGATKLASEMLIQEYTHAYRLRSWTNRCGVIAGPGQFGKADQGIFTLWVAHHAFNQGLKYLGFGGTGKQVRDLLHVSDLAELIDLQIQNPQVGEVFNVGGGREVSASLKEYTRLCQAITGNSVSIESSPTTTLVDIPLYISDCTRLKKSYNWSPRHNVEQIVQDTYGWIQKNQRVLEPIFKGGS